MSDNTAAIIVLMMFSAWVLLVWGVTTYAVFWLDRSGWWFLLAMVLTSGSASVSTGARAKGSAE